MSKAKADETYDQWYAAFKALLDARTALSRAESAHRSAQEKFNRCASIEQHLKEQMFSARKERDA